MLKLFKKNLNDILNYILVILLFFLAIKKGGFYKTDILHFSLGLEIIGCISIVYSYIKNKNKIKFDIIGIVLLLLSVSYLLPILFNNYTSLNDSLVEFTRYFNMYIIYKIVMLSEHKQIFKYTLVYLGVFLGILGIDGIANRFLENVLKYFSSGYLNIDLTRMSSTIQYANVLAIILLISAILVFDELVKSLEESNKKRVVLNYCMLFFDLFCLILTQSRTVIAIACIYFLTYLFSKNKRIEKIYMLLILVIQLIIFSIFAFKVIYINTIYLYHLIMISLLISIALSLAIFYISTNKENKITKVLYEKYKFVFCCIGVLAIVYVVLGLNISYPLKISESSKDTVKRYVYNVEKSSKNNLRFSVYPQNDDSRYSVNIYKVSSNNSKELLKTFEYYNTVSGNFELEFDLDNNTKKIEIVFDCYKGSILIDNAVFNNKKVILDYVFFPTDMINKFMDVVLGTDSATSRFTYLKDALKIWNLSLKNKIIGVGGEGFKNNYQLVQTQSYTSTEVHNSFVQILVESGMIGFILIVFAVIYYLARYKNNVYKYSLLVIVIHSIFDLDFSYMIVLTIFAILLGINEKNKSNNKIISKIYLEEIMAVCIFVFSFVLIVRQNMAYSMKVPALDEESITFSKQATLVSYLEKRVMLDPSENKYRKALSSEYEKYLIMLNENIEKDIKNTKLIEEQNNIVQNIEQNAKSMQENQKQVKETLIDVSNIYFNNIYHLVNENYKKNKEEGYKYYLDKIKKNLEFIEDKYRYNALAKELVRECYNKYYQELNDNKFNSKSINEFVEYLETKN